MSLHPRRPAAIPEDTARAARAAFRRGNPYLRLRDTLGPLFTDADFQALYPRQGQPAASPACLATVSILQFMEHLTDRQAADAVRSRIDWKYLLGLPLTASGFDASVLSEFRDRLLTSQAEALLFTQVLERLRDQGFLDRRRQRTDSTHVLGAIRTLNRLELVGETMRATLNALAVAAPDWLRTHSPPQWVERYGPRIEESRLPKGEQKRAELAHTIGADGAALLAAIETAEVGWLQDLPAVQRLRTVWEQQYRREAEDLVWRRTGELPASAEQLCSPYEPDVRYSEKRESSWEGYKVHLTETCEAQTPNLITQVTTTAAPTTDDTTLPAIQADLVQRHLAPAIHVIDSGYIDGELLAVSQAQYGIELYGPVVPDTSWQARASAGFALADFTLDWEHRRASCPQGRQSSTWRETTDNRGAPCIQIHFRHHDCHACPVRAQCTRGDRRSITVRPQAAHEARLRALARQVQPAFAAQYASRAGIEGTISQGVRRCDLRQARYRGLAKVRLQHLLIGSALNLVRVAAWLADEPRASTRHSTYQRLMAPAA